MFYDPPPPPLPHVGTMEVVVTPCVQIRFWDAVLSVNREGLIRGIRNRSIIGLNDLDAVIPSRGVEEYITPLQWALRVNDAELARIIEEYALLEASEVPRSSQPHSIPDSLRTDDRKSSLSILDWYMSPDDPSST